MMLIGAAGCAPKDEIQVYSRCRPPYNEVRKQVTLLAVIVPQSDRINWVFRSTGRRRKSLPSVPRS